MSSPNINQEIAFVTGSLNALQAAWKGISTPVLEAITAKESLDKQIVELVTDNKVLTQQNQEATTRIAVLEPQAAKAIELEARVDTLAKENGLLVQKSQDDAKRIRELEQQIAQNKPILDMAKALSVAMSGTTAVAVAEAAPERASPEKPQEQSRAKSPELPHDADKWVNRAKKFQAAVTQDPNNPQPYFELGHALYKIKNYKEASAAFLQAADKGYNREDWMLWHYQARCYFKLGDLSRASHAVDMSIDCKGGREKGANYHLRAQILLVTSSLPAARHAIDKAKEKGADVTDLEKDYAAKASAK